MNKNTDNTIVEIIIKYPNHELDENIKKNTDLEVEETYIMKPGKAINVLYWNDTIDRLHELNKMGDKL